jgi:hypothetical protein
MSGTYWPSWGSSTFRSGIEVIIFSFHSYDSPLVAFSSLSFCFSYYLFLDFPFSFFILAYGDVISYEPTFT